MLHATLLLLLALFLSLLSTGGADQDEGFAITVPPVDDPSLAPSPLLGVASDWRPPRCRDRDEILFQACLSSLKAVCSCTKAQRGSNCPKKVSRKCETPSRNVAEVRRFRKAVRKRYFDWCGY